MTCTYAPIYLHQPTKQTNITTPTNINNQTPTTPQAIKFLQQAVGLRGYAARDPLTEFKLEGYNLFLETTAQVGCVGGERALKYAACLLPWRAAGLRTAFCWRLLHSPGC